MSDQVNKPKMPEDGITKTIETAIHCELSADFDRFSTGTMLMSLTEAKFKSNGASGVLRIDIGGTVAEVKIGSRSWRIRLVDIIMAATEADEQYLAEGKL